MLLAFPARVSGQTGGVLLPEAPSGFVGSSSAPSGFVGGTASDVSDDGFWGGILDGMNLNTSLTTTYNSNVAPNQGITISNTAKDDYIFTLGGTLNYLSQASGFTFGGSYRGTYNQYLNHTDFSGYGQGATLVANYVGGRFTVAASMGFDVDQGVNTNYASNFVEQTSWRSALTIRYLLSPKTSLQGELRQNSTSVSTGTYSDTSSYSFGASALWKYSPLTEFGPGIRYTCTAGSTQNSLISIGPTMNLNYQLSTKVALKSGFGMNFSSYENGGSADPTFSASIGLNYVASQLWGMNFSLYRDTQADTYTTGSFSEVTSLRLGYHRKVRRAIVNLGLGYTTRMYLDSGNAPTVNRPDQNQLNIDTSIEMPVFSNTCIASIFCRYNEQTGASGVAGGAWSSVQSGFKISRKF
jgi:hypothetical protein